MLQIRGARNHHHLDIEWRTWLTAGPRKFETKKISICDSLDNKLGEMYRRIRGPKLVLVLRSQVALSSTGGDYVVSVTRFISVAYE